MLSKLNQMENFPSVKNKSLNSVSKLVSRKRVGIKFCSIDHSLEIISHNYYHTIYFLCSLSYCKNKISVSLGDT